jgi:hypothetical protein
MHAATPIKSAAAAALSLLCLAAVAATVAHRPLTQPAAPQHAETAPAPVIAPLQAEPEMQVVTVTARRPIPTIVITAKRPTAGSQAE